MLQRKINWNENIDDLSFMYVPLRQVNVDATIRSFAANVTITQVFQNDENIPIEAVYCFPIEQQAAIYEFVARIDDRVTVAELKEKTQAQRQYNDALRENNGAYMLEQDEESQDNFIINVGALQPNQECHITISYVTELDLVENGTKIRFVVPTTIAPRYNPNQGGIGSPADTRAQYVSSAPYTIEFHCSVEKHGISRVSSISHPIQIDVNREDVYMIEFSQKNTHLDRDIIMDFELAENRSNTIFAVESGVLMTSFMPTEQDCQRVINDSNITNEFIFILDCSGSMDGENKIGLARQAMLLFLKNLPVDCHFNIIRFGDNYKSLFNDITVIYNEENARQAELLIKDTKADFGGTKLLPPLRWLKENPPKENNARQIFLLTDGEISNVDQVLDLCRSMVSSTRIFSFGLGHAPSRALIKGLARATDGCSVFIPPNAYVDVFVAEQLQKALQPCLTNVHIKLNIESTLVNIVPTSSPPVFINDRLLVYAILNNDKTTSFDHDVNVELYSQQHRLCEAKVNRIPHVSNDGMIARLAAKALILELQHSKLESSNNNDSNEIQQLDTSNAIIKMSKEQMKEKIIEISLKYNILSPYTAFIGIEKRVNTSNENLVLREVPIEISADNQYFKYLEAEVNRIRHEENRHHNFDDMRHAATELSNAANRNRHNQRSFDRMSNIYDKARAYLAVVVQNYESARKDYNSTNADRNQVQQRLDSLCADYTEARKQLEHTRRRYDKARQELDFVQTEYAHMENRFENFAHEYVYDRKHPGFYDRHFDRVWQQYDFARHQCVRVAHKKLDRTLNDYDRAQAMYDNVIDSIDQNYQVEKDSSSTTTSDVHSQQLSECYVDALHSAEALFQQAHQSLEQYEKTRDRTDEHLREVINDISKEIKQASKLGYSSGRESFHYSDRGPSTKVRHAERLLEQAQQKKQSFKNTHAIIRQHAQGDLDLVRDIIGHQNFDGLWKVDEKFIEKLIGKSLSEFPQTTTTEVLISTIMIIVLETRFASLSSMWCGVVQKARKRLLSMLDNDSVKFNTLQDDIRKQL